VEGPNELKVDLVEKMRQLHIKIQMIVMALWTEI
jgi:hypothetical protein